MFSACKSGGKKRRSIRWQEPRLESLEQLSIFFRGKPKGRFQAIFTKADGSKAPQGTVSFSAARAVRVSKEILACSIKLPVPCCQPLKLVIQKEGKAKELASFELDPTHLLKELWTPINGLKGASFERLVKGVNQMRVRYMGDRRKSGWFQAQLIGRKKLLSLLAAEKVDSKKLRSLRKTIPEVAKLGLKEKRKLAKELRSLQLLEALIASPQGIKPPWGNLNKALGFKFVPTHELSVGNGWTWLAKKRVAKRLPKPGKPQYLLDRWQPLATNKLLKISRSHGIQNTLHFAVKTFSTPLDELTAPQDSYVPRLSFVLDSKGARTGRWPPRRARVDLLVRTFVREAVLSIVVNGQEKIEVVNAAQHSVAQADFVERQTLQISLPINPNHLRAYENEVILTFDKIPFEGDPFPLRIAEIGIAVSNRMEDE